MVQPNQKQGTNKPCTSRTRTLLMLAQHTADTTVPVHSLPFENPYKCLLELSTDRSKVLLKSLGTLDPPTGGNGRGLPAAAPLINLKPLPRLTGIHRRPLQLSTIRTLPSTRCTTPATARRPPFRYIASPSYRI